MTCPSPDRKVRQRAPYRAAPAFIAEAVQRALAGEQDCIDWPYATSERYGSIRIGGRTQRAHLVALEQAGRVMTPGMDQRHRCGRRICINISHLEEGTRVQNMADAIEHGSIARGRRHGRSTLEEASVLAIRASQESSAVLAERYGVRPNQITRIRARTSWAWLT